MLTLIGRKRGATEKAADLSGSCWMILCETTQLSCFLSPIDRHLTTGFQHHPLTNPVDRNRFRLLIKHHLHYDTTNRDNTNKKAAKSQNLTK